MKQLLVSNHHLMWKSIKATGLLINIASNFIAPHFTHHTPHAIIARNNFSTHPKWSPCVNLLKILIALSIMILLSACQTYEQVPVYAKDFKANDKFRVRYKKTGSLGEFYPRPGYTYVTFDRGHGIQIEYFSPNSKAYLWYPGNSRAVPSLYRYMGWNYDKDAATPSNISTVQFLYPGASYNPVTKEYGGQWEDSPRNQRERLVASKPGDVFNLSSGRVPYRRDKCDLPDKIKPQRSFSCGDQNY